MGKAATYEDIIRTIALNYREIEHSIVNQLLINVPNHHPTEGSYRETVWKSLFEMVIPRKYCIEQGVFIIDSYGHKSKEADLVIFDELYTPYIFNYGKIKFIPIEAVAAVVQCKSKSENIKSAEIKCWVESIDTLTTSLDSVARTSASMVDNMNASENKGKATQTATRPLKLLCAIENKSSLSEYEEYFDIILSVNYKNKKLNKSIPNKDRSLNEWNDSLNHVIKGIQDPDDNKYREELKKKNETAANRERILKNLQVPQSDDNQDENTILSLIFQMNQLLMVMNNPMLFPHHAYAHRFSEILKKSSHSKGENRGSDYILAMYDVSGIQDYIFATNRLRENAGASCQVTRILNEFLVDALRETASRENAEIAINWKDENELKLPKQENIRAEIIYIGGGNGMVLFRDLEFYQKAGEVLGIRTAVNCQGLYLAAAYIKTGLDCFKEDLSKLKGKMQNLKRSMVRQPIYSPFPVVEQDDSSHQPITCRICGKNTEDVTRIQFQKRSAYKNIEHNASLFPKLRDGRNYGYPEEMDQLCRKHGEDSSIAIVHIDGNGMGERVNKLIGEFGEYSQGVQNIRCESKGIARLFQDTYAEVLQKLWDYRVFISGDGTEEEKEGKKMFPLRPLLLDGDDFTFLCRAELALPIAAAFMNTLMQKQQMETEKISACGGIAFVHSHFPFRLAYSIAEDSCSIAKGKWYEEKQMSKEGMNSCFLDFQVIKESELELPEKNRKWEKHPFSLNGNVHDKERNSLAELYHVMERMEQDWPSGRLHKIYRALQSGDSELEFLRREFASRGYDLNDLVQGKWQDSQMLDAIELYGLCRLDLLKEFLNIQ